MRTLAVTSGKGGVGKTNLSANLAISLARRGARVTVFDADIGMANLDVVLGVAAKGTLQQVLSGDKKLADVVAIGPGGVKFVGGGSGVETMVNLTGRGGEAFLAEVRELEANNDVVVFDTGAGIDANVMTFLGAADEILLVLTPDPASLTDGYATAKAILQRDPAATVRVVMNMVEDEAQAKAVFTRVNSIAKEFLGSPLHYCGSVRSDPRAAAFVRQRKPWVLADPNLPASRDVDAIAASIMGQAAPERRGGTSLADRLREMFARRTAA